MRKWLVLLAFACSPAIPLAQGDVPGNPPPAGLVITGDKEAPLVLYIVPWQAPKVAPPPEVALQPLLPRVLDHPRSLLDDPINQSASPRPAASPKR